MLGLGWKAAALMATVALGAGAWGAWEAKKADRATERAQVSEAIVDWLEQVLEAERQAAEVLRAERDRFAARAQEYDELREDLIEGGDDADIPDWLRAYLDRLLTGNAAGGAASPD